MIQGGGFITVRSKPTIGAGFI